ncbi:MAG: IS481 family transposase [Acidovorax sp.]|jgi:transposase InsO family protein|nr:IS481 family transposase [Acidovorax sp.]
MDEKLLFIADHLRSGISFTELCRRYSISRKTGYKWVERYRQLGVEGLQEQSRRPQHNCFALSYAQRQTIVKLRASTAGQLGPKKLLVLLKQQWGEENTPSKTTIYNILKAEGLIKGQRKRRRVHPTEQPLRSSDEPNGLWSVDYKGQFKTANGCWCYPLTIMDHASRYLLAVDVYPSTNFKDALQSFERVFREYGLPDRIRSDNGAPFASTGVAGLSRLAVWWIRLGIKPERIERGKPQQNGRHERMHRTLKQALCKEPAADLKALQAQLDVFRHHYNTQRPHESLEQQAPCRRYKASPRAWPEKLPSVKYLPHWETSTVSRNGLIYWQGLRIYIGYLLAGQTVGMEQVAAGQWDVYFAAVRIGCFNENDKGGSEGDYISLKVSPMSVN